MNKASLELFVESKLKGTPLFGFSYLNRVKNFCSIFSKELDFDEDILFYALMLHCIESKKLIDYGIEFHSASAIVAKKFLLNSHEKNERIEIIVSCIKNAGVNGLPDSVEGRILQNAVLAEFLGSTGIAYSLYLSGTRKFSSRKLIDFLQGFLFSAKQVVLLDSSSKTIILRLNSFESFLSDLVKEFS
ncbi:MAG: hypothetical protein JW703_02190 [Candidatus Diapherotrites archaeon]|nr:hypothetical protein [Candidatus Diapherotrites archaeon]